MTLRISYECESEHMIVKLIRRVKTNHFNYSENCVDTARLLTQAARLIRNNQENLKNSADFINQSRIVEVERLQTKVKLIRA